jgi:hypothetical protein
MARREPGARHRAICPNQAVLSWTFIWTCIVIAAPNSGQARTRRCRPPGLPEPGTYDQVAYRGEPESGEFIASWLSGGSVVAGTNVNVWDVNDAIQSLICRAGPVGLGRLTDPDVPLGEL